MFITTCCDAYNCAGIQYWRWSFYHHAGVSRNWSVIYIHICSYKHHLLIILTQIIGNQIISLPSAVQTNNVQLQWRALLNSKWSLDNVRIGSDALLYYLQFEIQVGDCSPPPINGSTSEYISLEYYDGSRWSLLQTECLHPKCFIMVMIYLFVHVYHHMYKHNKICIKIIWFQVSVFTIHPCACILGYL